MKLRKPFRILRNLILFFLYLLDRCRHFLSIRAGICHSTYDYPLCPATRFGRKVVCKHTWVPFDKISPSLPMAVIASEDNRFASHNGFDMIEIKKAMKENETRKRNGVPVPSASRQRKRLSLATIFVDTKRI